MAQTGPFVARHARGTAPSGSGSVVVGVSDMRVAKGNAVLVTHALGSCIAVCAYDAGSKVGGMLHFMLPDSSINAGDGRTKTHTFADTGIPALIDAMVRAGANPRTMLVKLVGGASVARLELGSNLGRRNVLAARKICWKNRCRVVAEEVEGNISRTVHMALNDGVVVISSPHLASRRI